MTAKKTADRNLIEWKGSKYRLEFDLNVMEAIQDEYGSLDEWGKLSSDNGHGEPDIKAVKFGFRKMINEAIDIDNDEHGADLKPLTASQVGRLISSVGMETITNAMQGIVAASAGGDAKN